MQRFKIAGLTVDMNIKYQRLKNQCRAYEIPYSNTEADITLNIEEITYQKARKEYPSVSDEDLEYMMYGFLFYDKLLDFEGIMLHASAVSVGGYAYLFSADSGVGKSTHTSHWLKLFGEKAFILNDDKPALRYINGKFYCFGTPFSGKFDINKNTAVQLGGICFLNRGSENKIEKINSESAFKYIYRQTQSFNDTVRIEKRLELLDKLLSIADCYYMECIDDISAAKMSFDKMKKSLPVTLNEVSGILEDELKKGNKVKFKTKGRSMYPLLLDGRDSVVLKKINKIKINDIVLFKTDSGEYKLHRVKKIKNESIFTRGDALSKYDKAVKKDSIIATAVSFERNGKTINADNIFYKIYSSLYTSDFILMLRVLKNKKIRRK